LATILMSKRQILHNYSFKQQASIMQYIPLRVRAGHGNGLGGDID
jgi:hypothetical protein